MTSWHLVGDTSSLTSLISSMQTRFNTCWTAYRAYNPTSTSVAKRELIVIDQPTGNVLSVHPLTLPASPAGSSGNIGLPPEVAEVVSVRTPTAGPSNRGRFYLPALTWDSLAADSTILSTYRSTIVNAYQAYFNGVFADAGFHLAVYSRLHRSTTESFQIDMGNIFDVQRRRRRSLVEARTAATLT
jgi:hypothetical protein